MEEKTINELEEEVNKIYPLIPENDFVDKVYWEDTPMEVVIKERKAWIAGALFILNSKNVKT